MKPKLYRASIEIRDDCKSEPISMKELVEILTRCEVPAGIKIEVTAIRKMRKA